MYTSGDAKIMLLKYFFKSPLRMEKPNLIKKDTVHRSLTPKHAFGKWLRAKVAHFHYSLNAEKMLPRAKKRGHSLLWSLKLNF